MDEAAILQDSMSHVRRCNMDPYGLHGVAHWWRVRHNGLLVAEQTRISVSVVKLFALIHDAFREDDEEDPEHGPRASKWLRELRGERPTICEVVSQSSRDAIMALSSQEFEALATACEFHSDPKFRPNCPCVATCLAADRLDLRRVGYIPDAERMFVGSHITTKAVIDAAMQRSLSGLSWESSDHFLQAWGIDIASIPCRNGH